MDEHSGKSTSVWTATADKPSFPTLAEHLYADVCVVGAGIAGLTTAYLLAKAGQAVVVVDDGPIASGESERTTAHLSNALDDRYYHLERLFGVDGARLAAESHSAAIDAIERIVHEEKIDCDFARLDGYLFNSPGEPADVLHRELAAAHRAGLEHVELVDRAPLVSFATGPALLFPNQAQFHPVRYLGALANAVTGLGARIYTGVHASEIEGGASCTVRTTHGWTVTAKAVVVATNSPVTDRVTVQSRQRPYRTYVIGVAVPLGTVPKVLYWDTADPYHYVRLQTGDPRGPRPARDLLIVGGEDHETGQANDMEERFARLEQWTRARFPMASDVRYRWSGQVLEPVDALAYIGPDPLGAENVYIVTGDSGHGMTHGTIAGLLLTDLICGRANPWARLYDPRRVVPSAAPEMLRENASIASQYIDWIAPGDVRTVEQIAPGDGAIVQRGLTKVAVFRDAVGRMHECSAVCPHLGGIVRWNRGEKTWDCPVHGSRFDCDGHVVNGPANSDLQPARATASRGSAG